MVLCCLWQVLQQLCDQQVSSPNAPSNAGPRLRNLEGSGVGNAENSHAARAVPVGPENRFGIQKEGAGRSVSVLAQKHQDIHAFSVTRDPGLTPVMVRLCSDDLSRPSQTACNRQA